MAKVKLSAEEWEIPGLVAMVNYGRKKQCEVRDEVFQRPPSFVLDSPYDENFLRRFDHRPPSINSLCPGARILNTRTSVPMIVKTRR